MNTKRTVFAVCQGLAHEVVDEALHEVSKIFFSVNEEKGVSWYVVKGRKIVHCVRGAIPLAGTVDLELLDHIDVFTMPDQIDTSEAFEEAVSDCF